MIQQYRDSNQVIWFDEELIEDPSQAIFDAEYWQSTNKVTGSASGRGTIGLFSLIRCKPLCVIIDVGVYLVS